MPKRKDTETPPVVPSLDAFMDEKDQARFSENKVLARKVRAAQAAFDEQLAELLNLRKQVEFYDRLIEAANAVRPIPDWLTPKKLDGPHRAIPSLLLTDVHFDEVIQPEEVEGFNKYNREIALARLERGFKKTVSLCRHYFAGVEYDGFQLFLGGDMLSGIIHEELTETNAGPLAESVVTILDPLEAGIKLLAKEFGRVHVTCVVGNHGRRTRKPRSKFRAKDNFDWMIYKLLQRNLTSPTTSFDVSPSADASVTLYNTRYRLTHGDQFKGGSGISAELSPLLLGSHRKAKRQAAIGKPYDVLVMGHWHQTLWLPSKGIIMGGSVCGYNEFAYMNNFAAEAPQCSLWLTTPEYGITLCSPVFVQNRQMEGW